MAANARSEGQVVLTRRGRSRGIAHDASVAAEHVLERARASADGVRKGDGRIAIALSGDIVDERRVLRDERRDGDIEGVLEKDDGGELGCEHELGHRGRVRRARASASAARHGAGARLGPVRPARSLATCCL